MRSQRANLCVNIFYGLCAVPWIQTGHSGGREAGSVRSHGDFQTGGQGDKSHPTNHDTCLHSDRIGSRCWFCWWQCAFRGRQKLVDQKEAGEVPERRPRKARGQVGARWGSGRGWAGAGCGWQRRRAGGCGWRGGLSGWGAGLKPIWQDSGQNEQTPRAGQQESDQILRVISYQGGGFPLG